MSHAARQINFSKALSDVKQVVSFDTIRSLVIASSVMFKQGISFTHEEVDSMIKQEIKTQFFKEVVIYHENLSTARYYKVLFQDETHFLLMNLGTKEKVLISNERMRDFKPIDEPTLCKGQA